MNFLAPLFLLGGLAIALPVLFHLIRRSTRERQMFSSLLFLSPSPPRLTRRSRLEHLLLLALRCAILCLLALAFARPFIKKLLASPAPAADGRRLVVLLDTSASMRRGNLWQQALEQARAAVSSARTADEVALLSFSRGVTQLFTFDQWKAAPASQRSAFALAALRDVSPGWGGTYLAEALTSARDLLAEKRDGGQAAGEIILISDLQEGSHAEALQAFEWPKEITLRLQRLKPGANGNAGLQLLLNPDQPAAASKTVRLRVSNSPDSTREQFKVGWMPNSGDAFTTTPLEVYVPAGQSRIVNLGRPEGTNASLSAKDSMRTGLQGDAEPFDNFVYVVPSHVGEQTVLCFSRDPETDAHSPLFFLERAFEHSGPVRLKLQRPDAGLTVQDTEEASLVLLLDSISNDAAQAVRNRLEKGGLVLMLLRNQGSGAEILSSLGVPGAQLEEAKVSSYAILSELELRHPLFAPFAAPRYGDFTKIHFWRYRRVSGLESARILARFDTGDPALLEVSVGKGQLYLLTSGWQQEDSQLALSSKFVPLLYSFLELSRPGAAEESNYAVGDSVALPDSSEPLVIYTPAGQSVALPAGTKQFAGTSLPGIYQISFGRQTNYVAVNLDPAESRTAPIAAEQLEALGAPVGSERSSLLTAREHPPQLQAAELENRQKLWWKLLLATFALMILETWYSGRAARSMTARPAKVPA